MTTFITVDQRSHFTHFLETGLAGALIQLLYGTMRGVAQEDELKKRLAMQRRHRAALSVAENCPEVEEEVDPVEENLYKHIEQEKKFYKSSIGGLKALRTEIEHLQLLLERAKVKLQRDFHKWWSLEASNVQESEATARCPAGSPLGTSQPPLPSTPGFCSERGSGADPEPNPDSSTAVGDLRRFTPKRLPLSEAVEAGREETSDQRGADLPSSSEWRALSTTKLSSSIPLTGDQQTDADILAFVQARQNLLNRTGLSNNRKLSSSDSLYHTST